MKWWNTTLQVSGHDSVDLLFQTLETGMSSCWVKCRGKITWNWVVYSCKECDITLSFNSIECCHTYSLLSASLAFRHRYLDLTQPMSTWSMSTWIQKVSQSENKSNCQSLEFEISRNLKEFHFNFCWISWAVSCLHLILCPSYCFRHLLLRSLHWKPFVSKSSSRGNHAGLRWVFLSSFVAFSQRIL